MNNEPPTWKLTRLLLHYLVSSYLKIMSAKIKVQELHLTMKKSPKETSDLVTLISASVQNTGLSSYTSKPRVHWASYIATFCFILTCMLQVIALYMAKNDPDRLFECFSVLAFCGMGLYKLKSLRSNQARWRFLLNQISVLENEESNHLFKSDTEYHSEDEDNYNFTNYICEYTNKFKTTSTILQKIYNITAVIFILSPFLEHLLAKLRGLKSLDYPHILPGWAPLDDYSIYGYLITVICECVASVYCVYVQIAFDLTAIGIMIFICGQFSLLRDYCKRIGGNGKYCKGSKKRDARASFRIRHCHRINMILVNSITELDKLLKNIIGVYYFLATLTLCSVAVQLKSSEDMTVMQFVSLIQYMCGTLTQLYLFCCYGDAVLNESSISMGQGTFSAAYWCLSPRIRRDLVLLSISMITPRHLRAGPFNYIDLPSFIQVIRTAYSYYAVVGQKSNI